MQIKILPQNNSKYHNKKCLVNGIKFDSLKEAKRYISLYYREKAGEIFKLQLQVSIPVIINKKKLCTYIADFVYYTRQGAMVVEDAKGMKTPVYNLKKKLMFIVNGIEIIET